MKTILFIIGCGFAFMLLIGCRSTTHCTVDNCVCNCCEMCKCSGGICDCGCKNGHCKCGCKDCKCLNCSNFNCTDGVCRPTK